MNPYSARLWAASILVLLVGCGKLSKGAARDLLQKTYYDKDDNTYCTWDLGHLGVPEDRKKTSREFDFISGSSGDEQDRACVADLVGVGVLAKKGEPLTLPGPYGGGTDYTFVLANKDVDFTKTGDLQFPCGKKKLGDVLSVSTDGRKATVKYTRTITRDDGPAEEATTQDCARLQGPTAGEETQTMLLRRDDDGDWAPDY